MEGVLAARGFGSLPDKYRSGMSIGTEVRFFDQFDRCYPVEVELRVIHDGPGVRATAPQGIHALIRHAGTEGKI